MGVDLGKYEGIILDGSFFNKVFPKELSDQFHGKTFWFPMSFNDIRMQQYYPVLTDEQKEAFNTNWELLSVGKQEYLKKHRDLERSLQDLSQQAESKGEQYLYMTADRIQIQKTVLRKLYLDLYDLNEDLLMRKEDFPEFIQTKGYEFWNDRDERLPDVEFKQNSEKDPKRAQTDAKNYKRAKPDVLYDEQGNPVRLRKNKNNISPSYGSGAEARLFILKDDPERLAKVFYPEKRTDGKKSNVAALKEIGKNCSIEWAMLPQQLLYWDSECRHFAGFVQRLIKEKEPLDQYLPDQLPGEENWIWRDESCCSALELALRLTRQYLYLNTYGIYICDFNPGNFAVSLSERDHLLMWDTDSFNLGNYFSGSMRNDFCGRNRHAEKKIGAKLDVLDMCTEELYMMVYWILTFRQQPLQGVSDDEEEVQVYQYVSPDKDPCLSRIIPMNLLKLFRQVFEKRELPSADLLLYELAQAIENWTRIDPNLTYEQLLYGEAEAQIPAEEDKIPHRRGDVRHRDIRRSKKRTEEVSAAEPEAVPDDKQTATSSEAENDRDHDVKEEALLAESNIMVLSAQTLIPSESENERDENGQEEVQPEEPAAVLLVEEKITPAEEEDQRNRAVIQSNSARDVDQPRERESRKRAVEKSLPIKAEESRKRERTQPEPVRKPAQQNKHESMQRDEERRTLARRERQRDQVPFMDRALTSSEVESHFAAPFLMRVSIPRIQLPAEICNTRCERQGIKQQTVIPFKRNKYASEDDFLRLTRPKKQRRGGIPRWVVMVVLLAVLIWMIFFVDVNTLSVWRDYAAGLADILKEFFAKIPGFFSGLTEQCREWLHNLFPNLI